jgi:hypothetical protein
MPPARRCGEVHRGGQRTPKEHPEQPWRWDGNTSSPAEGARHACDLERNGHRRERRHGRRRRQPLLPAGGAAPTTWCDRRTPTPWCPWKGTASYYSLEVDGQVNPDAVWYYPDPKPKAAMVADRVAFWKGVVVTE